MPWTQTLKNPKIFSHNSCFLHLAVFPEVNLAYVREEGKSFDNSMGLLINQSQAGCSQTLNTISPQHPTASTLERNPLGDSTQQSPTRPNNNNNMLGQKYTMHSCVTTGPFFFCLAQVSTSLHSNGAYCTVRQKERHPSLWASDRPCLDWKGALTEQIRVRMWGVRCTEKSVSPGKPKRLSVPAQSSPHNTSPTTLSHSLPPSLVVQQPSS